MLTALLGNANCGKTTLFNRLTGARQHVGNFPGVTVEMTRGQARDFELVDLPGIFSLVPKSRDEAVSSDFLKNEKPDCIINIVDATNLDKNLALTLELLKLNIPVVLALNMMDEVKQNGMILDFDKLSKLLGIVVVPISAAKNQGIDKLCEAVKNCKKNAKIAIKYEYSTDYSYLAQKIAKEITIKEGKNLAKEFSNKLDKVLTHPVFGIPIFFCIMAAVFYFSFSAMGALLTTLFSFVTEYIEEFLENILNLLQLSLPIRSLLFDGVISGIMSVIFFLPTIATLFLFLSILEDSGYMARVVNMFDKLMQRLGLGGKSVVPLLLGFGCSVPAIMSTRIIPNERQRLRTVRMIPFVPCSAKIPILSIFCVTFFPKTATLAMICLYIISLLCAVIYLYFTQKRHINEKTASVLPDLPPYRMPTLQNTMIFLWEKIKGFFSKAFSVIFLASLAIWALSNFNLRLEYSPDVSQSILAYFGKLIAPIFKPLGINDWRFGVAILCGLFAKEAIISTLAVLFSVQKAGLPLALAPLLPQSAALAFLIFAFLYSPCAAAFAATKKELNSTKATIKLFVLQTVIAYIIALFVAIIF